MTKLGLGHRPDLLDHVAEDLRDRHITSLIGTSVSMSEGRDWRYLDSLVFNQGPAESCVLHAGTDGVYMAGKGADARGIAPAIPRPSILYPWKVARLLDQGLDGVPVNERVLYNAGVRPRAAVLAMQEHGLVSETFMQFDLTKINDDFEFSADVAAADALLTGHYRIPDTDESLLIKLASDRCHFPIVAFDWYQSYAEYSGGEPLDEPRGELRGRHMMLVVGYRDGHILFKNSHGAEWGDGGYAWVRERVVDSHYCRDGLVFTAAPRIAA